jgi:hypothetical protein
MLAISHTQKGRTHGSCLSMSMVKLDARDSVTEVRYS